MKLTKHQDDIVTLLKDGWEMSYNERFITSSRISRRYWLQKNGIGKGGETRNISEKLFYFLIVNKYAEAFAPNKWRYSNYWEVYDRQTQIHS